jgi:hypothetical protein
MKTLANLLESLLAALTLPKQKPVLIPIPVVKKIDRPH